MFAVHESKYPQNISINLFFSLKCKNIYIFFLFILFVFFKQKTTLEFSVKNPEAMPHLLSLRFHSLMWAHIHKQSPLTC